MNRSVKKIFTYISVIFFIAVGMLSPVGAIGWTVYFNDAAPGAGVVGDWGDVLNWWTDNTFTVPAGDLPDSSADVILYSPVTSNSGPVPDINMLTVQVGYTDIPIMVNFGAEYLSNTYNNNTLTLLGWTAIFSDSSYNQGSIDGSAEFQDTAYNAWSITGNVDFYDASGNSSGGNVAGTATYHETTYGVSQFAGTFSGDVAFSDAVTFTLAGTDIWALNTTAWIFSGDHDWIFNDSATNDGTILGDATFNDGSSNGLTGTVVGDGHYYDTSTNAGTQSGTLAVHDGRALSVVNVGGNFSRAHFYDSSSNDTVITSSDDTIFYDSSANNGIVTNNAQFYGMSTNSSAVTGVTGVHGNRALSTLGGTYYDVQFYDTTYNDTTLSGNADFYDSSYNDVIGIVPGNATFNDTTYNAGTLNGNAQLNDSSYNAGTGIIIGTAYMACDAYNDLGGTIGGLITYEACTQYTASATDWDDVAAWWLDAGMTDEAHRVPSSIDDVFINNSITTNSGAPAVVNNLTVNNASDVGIDITVMGSATFNNTSTNSAAITWTTTFNNSSTNQGTVVGTTTFNGTSSNAANATVSGNAFFNNFATNDAGSPAGLVTGDAIFACFADNDGDVSGLTTYTACSAPATPAILSADDKGASSSDAITNDTTPAITGSCSTSLIHVYFDSVFLSSIGNDGVTCTSSGGTYTIPTLTPLADGIYTIDAMQSNGRGLGFGDSPFSSDRTLIIDTIPPTLTLEQKSGQSDPTNGSMVYRVVFSETIYTATFTTSDITLTGTGSGTVSSVSQVTPFDGTTFDVTINGTSDGTIIADISTNKVTDIAGNANTTASVSTDKTIEFDDTNPTVALTSLVSSPLSATFTVTATFSEAVSGLALGDFTIGNGTAGNLIIVSPTVATIDITPTADGLVTVDLPGFRVIDPATNGNTVAPQLSRIADLTSPNVTIDQASGQVDPTITSDITFTAVFDEALASFDCTDVTVINGACVSVTLDSGSTYTILVNGYSSAVVATVDAGATTDIAGNGNNQSTSTDNSVTFNPPSGGGSSNTAQTPKKTGGSGFSIGTPTTKNTTTKTTAVPTTTNATATETSQTSITNTTTPIPLNAASEDTVITTTAYDAQSFTKLQKQYGNEVITREFFQNRCVTDNGKPYFRSCENGYALKTTYEFHQNMICEGFVVAKKSSYTDAATRRDVLTMALKMRTKKATEDKKILPFSNGMFLDVTTPGLTRIVSQSLQYGLIAEKPYFRPENGITRAEAYAMIMKSVCMTYTSVNPVNRVNPVKETNTWLTWFNVSNGNNVSWQENLFQTARGNSMTSKSSLEKFRPDSLLSRGELVALASRASDWAEKTGGCNPKPDVCFVR